MDTLNHNGLTYVKASILAKRYRYTTDYIGQLCRQQKVDAQLVGRAWYVNENSLLGHKVDRKKDTRPNEIVSKNAVEIVSSPENSVEHVSVHAALSKKTHRQFFANELSAPINHHWQNRAISYVDDTSILVPQVTNKIIKNLVEAAPVAEISAPISIDLADSETIPVRDTSEKVHQSLEFTPLPEITLTGDVSIVDMDTESDFIDSEPVSMDDLPTEPTPAVRPGVTLRYQKRNLDQKTVSFSEKVQTANSRQVHKKTDSSLPVVASQPVKMPVAARVSEVTSRPVWRTAVLPIVIAVSIVLAVVLVTASSIMVTDGSSVRESVSFHKSNFGEALILLSRQW